MSIRPACASLAVAFAMLAAPVHAQEAPEDEGEYWVQRKNQITVTATRAPILVSDAPVTVTVKTDEEIADELATDIKDLVRFEPGVSVTRQPARFGAALGTTGRGGNEGFTIRGIGGNRVLIQVDGVRVPDGFTFGAQSAGRGDYVDIGLVKSVEILRGPASALYGSDGLSGAVSFVTSDPNDIIGADKNFGGLVRVGYSSDDNEFTETAIVAGKTGSLSAMFAYTRRDFNELENQGGLGTGLAGAVNIGIGNGATRTLSNPQDGRSNAFLARLVFEPGGDHKFRLTGEYVDTRLDADILSGRSATVDSLTAHDTGERKRVTGDWSWTGDGTLQSARVAAYWQDAFDSQFTEELRTPAADRTRLNTFENRVYGAAADLRAGFDTGAIKHVIVLGSDVSFTRQQGVRGGTVPPPGEIFPTRAFPVTDFMLGGIFIGDEIAIADGALTLYPALRWDRYVLDPQDDPLLPTFAGAGQSGSKLSPKFGAVFKLSNNIRLFGNYTRGFKAPSPSQVNQFFENPAQGYRSIPSPNLSPETSESFEGGLRVTSDYVTGSITAFNANYDDFIDQVQVSGTGTVIDPIIFQFVNLGKVEVDGIEGKLDFNLPSGFNARVAAAFARGKTKTPTVPEGRLASIDPFTAVLGLGYREPTEGRFGGQFVLTYHGQKEIEAATNIGGCSGVTCYRPDVVFLADFTAHLRIADMITLRGGVFNIFDEKYALWSDVRGLADTSTTKDAYTRPGRNASVSVSLKF